MFEVQARLPDTAGDTAEFVVVTTLTTNAAAEVSWQLRLQLPDGEEARFGRTSERYSTGMRGAQAADTLFWKYADAGPYVGRVVWLDDDRETVVAETGGWLGNPDAPVLRLESLRTDPPTPRVGEPATVSVAAANHGQTTGSRWTSVWLWLDAQTYTEIGKVRFDDVGPGETRTASFVWLPRNTTNGTRLAARKSELTEGLVLAPYTVLPAAAAAADDRSLSAVPEEPAPPDRPTEDDDA